MKEYRKKVVKRLCFYALICLLLFTSLLATLILEDDSHLISYFSGFACGLGGVLLLYLFYYVRAILNDQKLEKMYIKEHDERNQELYLKSTSATLRLSVLGIASLSMYYVFVDYTKVQLISIILWMILIIKVVVSWYYKKRM